MNDRRKSDPERPGPSHHLGEDTLLDLLHNLLPEEEEERALSHLAVCSTCGELFRARVAERERLRATRVLRTLPSGELVAERREEVADAPEIVRLRFGKSLSDIWESFIAGFRRPGLSLAATAAVVTLVLLVVFWPRAAVPPGQASLGWLPAYTEDIRLRDAVDAVPDTALTRGLEAYAARDLERAVDLLETAQVGGPLETIRRVYLGSALAWDGRYEEGVSVLEDLPAHATPDPWRSEAQWTLLVALYESGQMSRADSLLGSLAKEPGSAGERARQFLKD